MKIINLDDYKKLIKSKRKTMFIQPTLLVKNNFDKLGYQEKDKMYFRNNASSMIEELRNNCWSEYVPVEKKFTSEMLKALVDETYINTLKSTEAIDWLMDECQGHIYELTLSNTQSRRSRAGKEFETILEFILVGSGVPIETQGSIGKKQFEKKGLGKLVDFVSPGVAEYVMNKRNTVLISAKTTLRERWQEVPEEMARTGAREMFLVTLDENISKEVLDTLYEANVQVTTLKRIKESRYCDNNRVLSFEELIDICLANAKKWEGYRHSIENE